MAVNVTPVIPGCDTDTRLRERTVGRDTPIPYAVIPIEQENGNVTALMRFRLSWRERIRAAIFGNVYVESLTDITGRLQPIVVTLQPPPIRWMSREERVAAAAARAEASRTRHGVGSNPKRRAHAARPGGNAPVVVVVREDGQP